MTEIEFDELMPESRKILVVDDEPGIRDLLAPFLERAGFIIQTAGDGVIALDKIKSFRPDLIILDVLMPEWNPQAPLVASCKVAGLPTSLDR